METNSENRQIQSVKDFSYTDFVGWINQTNVPPGAFSTVSQWALFSQMSPASHILEVACTTGFSIRELSRSTGASGVGFDLSGTAIQAARRNAAAAGTNRLRFFAADGYAFEPGESFTHIVVGAALGFFPDPARMLSRCLNWLEPRGHLLASPFYIRSEVPQSLIAEARQILGITPTLSSYKQVMGIYEGLQVKYENRQLIEPEGNDEIERYCTATIERFAKESGISSGDVLEQAHRRLWAVRDVTNRLRPYQAFSTLVLGYDRNEYPNRYVELF